MIHKKSVQVKLCCGLGFVLAAALVNGVHS
jgi:hypothetical protein